MARKQLEIIGTERANGIKELDAAAEAYVEARDKRMKLTVREVDTREALLSLMEKHKLEQYEDREADPPLLVLLDQKVKVKKLGDDDDAEKAE